MSGNNKMWIRICGLMLASTLVTTGCLQIDTTVDYHQDGSATVTERVNFSRRLLDMARAEGPQLQLMSLLQKEASLARMKSMGPGINLVSHKIQNGKKGSRESITVFKVADLNGFRYASPWLVYKDYAQNNQIEWSVTPLYHSKPYGGYGAGAAGSIAISFKHIKGRAKGSGRKTPDYSITPLNAQVYRELSPVVKDMLEDFQIKLTVKAYAPVFYTPNARGRRERAKTVDLLNITHQDLDRYGYNFFENEEIMLDLIQWKLGTKDIISNLHGYGSNITLPVVTPFGSAHMWFLGYTGNSIYMAPSKQLFDRFFKGKKLDFTQWKAGPPETHVLANFAKVGYHPQPGSKK